MFWVIIQRHVLLWISTSFQCSRCRLDVFGLMLLIWCRIISTRQASDRKLLDWLMVLRSFSFKFNKFTCVVTSALLFRCSRGFFLIYVTHIATNITQNWIIAVLYRNCVRRGLYFWCIWYLIFFQILVVIGTSCIWALLVVINIWRIP